MNYLKWLRKSTSRAIFLLHRVLACVFGYFTKGTIFQKHFLLPAFVRWPTEENGIRTANK